MNIIYSEHANKRLKQRGISLLDVEHVLEFPDYVKKSLKNMFEAYGEVKGRKLKVVFIKKESYIKVITVI
ncbi:MAG: DUF4258 domain-containing protein [Candidatus Woesearchaeota archaeon]